MASAAKHLVAGDLVAFPTETVYGLGADASNSKAVARIYSVKGRPSDHPLIVHIASLDRMGDWANEVPKYAISLAREFWPGPMTLVLKRSELAGDFVTGGQDTVGVRVPDHVVALAPLITATSLSQVLAQSQLSRMQSALMPQSLPLHQQMQQHFLLPANQQQLCAQR